MRSQTWLFQIWLFAKCTLSLRSFAPCCPLLRSFADLRLRSLACFLRLTAFGNPEMIRADRLRINSRELGEGVGYCHEDRKVFSSGIYTWRKYTSPNFELEVGFQKCRGQITAQHVLWVYQGKLHINKSVGHFGPSHKFLNFCE